MRGTLLLLSLLLAISVAGAQGAPQTERVSPGQTGFTVEPFTNSAANGPANLDPSVPANSAGAAAVAVPEPQTIAMMILGSGCLCALTLFRRRRRG